MIQAQRHHLKYGTRSDSGDELDIPPAYLPKFENPSLSSGVSDDDALEMLRKQWFAPYFSTDASDSLVWTFLHRQTNLKPCLAP